MKLAKSLKLALKILLHSKLRSWLSIIGIVIGVASVIAIMSLGEGMQQQLESNLGGLGADIVTVSPGFTRATGAMGSFREMHGHIAETNSENITLTNNDIQSLKLIPNINYIDGIVSKRADVSYLSKTAPVSISGVDTKVWKYVISTKLESGRYLSQGDKYVAVIGNDIAKNMFKEDIQLNRQIKIEGKPFTVIGILEASTGFGGSDRNIFIPIDIARTTLEDVGSKEFDSITIKVKDINLLDDTLMQIENKLMLVRAVNERTKDFSVNSVKATQETISQTLTTMTLFLGAIAAISLLVGAVGIANTMFTTVLEKTKEIGIMKSIGAKNKDILLIFLFNSGMIGLVGGIIGVLLGIFISKGLPSLLGRGLFTGRMASAATTVVTPQLAIFVFSFSILIGIIAGVIPAYRASKMNPVDALRYE